MDFDETYEKLQEKKELDELEEEVLLGFPSSGRSVSGISWEIHHTISRMRKLNEISEALEELKRLGLVETSEPELWKTTKVGTAVKQIKESEDKKLCEISKGDISKEAL